jgi:hypothetical protein
MTIHRLPLSSSRNFAKLPRNGELTAKSTLESNEVEKRTGPTGSPWSEQTAFWSRRM